MVLEIRIQPELINAEMAREAIDEVKRKKNPLALPLLRFESFREGPVVESIHKYIDESGRKRTGKHHEIYLSDIRRAAAEKWRTIIRQPVSG